MEWHWNGLLCADVPLRNCSLNHCVGELPRRGVLWGQYLLCCKISAKSDNPRPSYSCLTNCRWAPSVILDGWRKRIWTTSRAEDQIFYLHTKLNRWKYLDRWRRYALILEFERTPLGGGILLPVPNSTHISSYWNLLVCDPTKFKPFDTQTGDCTQ